ncbi:hypothetical protein ACGF5C_19690 [Micromonospora sp. NPDC047620]|uniref:hypothetical protein n=1 Tax=Micromonospora sp. NPDC047620 TaxID=3364251 RepID=UPI00371095B4
MIIRGSRREEPVIPAMHRWKVTCRKPGLTVDEQVARIVDRCSTTPNALAHLPMSWGGSTGRRARARCKSSGCSNTRTVRRRT